MEFTFDLHAAICPRMRPVIPCVQLYTQRLQREGIIYNTMLVVYILCVSVSVYTMDWWDHSVVWL